MKILATLSQRKVTIVTALAALALTALVTGSGADAATSEGLVCESNAHNTFSLTARDGYISTPDGNSIYMWGFGTSAGKFQMPGPNLCVTSGEKVTVVLHNTLTESTSIVFPGQTGVLADGKPAQPVFDGSLMTSMVTPADAGDGSVTYEFTAGSPGTYLYESGTNVDKQVQMGLYGALVVRPAGHPSQVSDRADSKFNPEKEYVFVLSEVDPDLHLAVERGEPVDWGSFRPRYFMINGRSMPDTLAPNNAKWLPHQPYGAFVHVKPYDATSNPDPAAIRYLNAGSVNYPFHPHGSDERIVNKDGQPLETPGHADLSYLKYDINVQPGEGIDALMDWRDVEKWDPVTNKIPTDLPAITGQMLVGTDTWFSESPYLGKKGDLPGNITVNNVCGEYYHVAHSHALQQATNYGATFGGMMTVFRIDPPSGCPGN